MKHFALLFITFYVLTFCSSKKNQNLLFYYSVDTTLKKSLLDSTFQVSTPNKIVVTTEGKILDSLTPNGSSVLINNAFIEDKKNQRFGFRKCAKYVNSDTIVIKFSDFMPSNENLMLKIVGKGYLIEYNEGQQLENWHSINPELRLSDNILNNKKLSLSGGVLDFLLINKGDSIRYAGWFITND